MIPAAAGYNETMQKVAYLWDVDPKKGISRELRAARIMMFGKLADWRRLLKTHDRAELRRYVVESKGRILDEHVLILWGAILGIPLATCERWMKGWIPWRG